MDLNVEVIFLLSFKEATGNACVDYFVTVGVSAVDLRLASDFAWLLLTEDLLILEFVCIEISGLSADDFNDASGCT